jgi:hypothetical protein
MILVRCLTRRDAIDLDTDAAWLEKSSQETCASERKEIASASAD